MHQQCERIGVEGAIGGVVEALRPGPCLHEPHQRWQPVVNLRWNRDAFLVCSHGSENPLELRLPS